MKTDSAGVWLRRMGEADLAHVMAIAAILKNAPHWPREVYLSALAPDSAPPRIALVAEDRANCALIGFTVASLLPPQAELESIAVSSAEQRRGIGRRLLFAMIEELKAAGVREVFLEVRASNQNALGFYRSLGFSESGRRSRYYADPEEDAVLMSLKLG